MTTADSFHLFKQIKCCVLVPTYNNAQTIRTVITDLLIYTEDICVVNDGSTDSTPEILKEFPKLTILSYNPNAGKGMALRRGFEFARSKGYDYCITIDSDGQHFAKDLPTFLNALAQNKNAVIIGARNMNQESVPGKSSFGNKFSNFWFKLETGIDLPDTQSGYRLYPIKALEGIRFFTRKYEFEIEVIVRAAWKGIQVIAVPITVYYPPKEERITHFRPFKDFSRISVLNTVLVLITFLWIKPIKFFNYFKKKSIREVWNEHFVRSHESALVKSLSVSVGAFFGIAPFWGAQMLMVYAVCHFFKLNKAISLIVSNVSIPPMIPFILYGSYLCGGIWMNGTETEDMFKQFTFLQFIEHWLSTVIQNFNLKDTQLSERIVSHIWQYILGSFTLASIASIFSGLVTYFLVKNMKQK